MPPILRRSAPILEAPQARAGENEGDPREIAIMAIAFERESEPIWGYFIEIIDRDVVINHPEGRDWMMWHQHESAEVLGRENNGSMTWTRDDNGLHMVSRENLEYPLTYWNDAYGQVRSGLVDGASFTFRPTREEWIDPEGRYDDGYPRIRVHEMTFYEGSPVTVPAYLDTSAEGRSDLFSRSAGLDSYEAAYNRYRASKPTRSYRPVQVARKRKLWLANQGLEV